MTMDRIEAVTDAILASLDWHKDEASARETARRIAVATLAAADRAAMANAEGVVRDIQAAIAPEAREATMRGWDMWRAAIAKDNAGGASWPRDAFEAHLDSLYEPLEQAAATIQKLQAQVAELEDRLDVAGK